MQEQLNQLYGYLHGMWRYRWSALLITWVVALLAWMFVFSLPNQYTAGAVIYVDTTSIMKPLLKDLALDVDTHDELKVMSRTLLSRENLLSVIRETDMALGVTSPLEKEALVERLTKDIDMRGGGKRDRSNIYEISYKGDSAEGAYKVVSVLLNNMIENTLNSGRTDTVTAQKFLNTQITEYEQRLSKAEQKLADFKKANIGFMPDDKGSYYGRLQRAQESVDNTRSALRLANQRYAELKKQLNGEVPLIDSTGYQSSRAQKLQKYQELLESLLNQYTDQHPDVLALKATIAELKATDNETQKAVPATAGSNSDAVVEFNPVYQELKVELSKASVEVEILKVQLADKRQVMKRLKDDIDVIPEVEARLSKLNRDYEVTRGRYLSLVERRESARLAQDAGQSSSNISFRVIEPPIVPVKPSGPARLLLLAASLFVALGAGLAWSFLKFMLEPTFFNMRQVSEKIGLPVLGTVRLYLSPQHKRERKLQLVSFLSVTCLLLLVFGGVITFHKTGAELIGSAVADFSQKLGEG
ncbi:MAG TPA: hypothetical protein ENJ87_00155 [Gammaproteobacteria bacterium]|nr:hypothetical protein [Gammaproteobacteria bacterium]